MGAAGGHNEVTLAVSRMRCNSTECDSYILSLDSNASVCVACISDHVAMAEAVETRKDTTALRSGRSRHAPTNSGRAQVCGARRYFLKRSSKAWRASL